jgi:dolichol kinase
MTAQNLVRRITIGLLVTVVILYLITGFGITEFRIVETLTFGLLTKNLSFQIHDNLLIPFLILLGMHIFLAIRRNRAKPG